jgi:hypothetical protein
MKSQLALACLPVLVMVALVPPVSAWSNGGYSSDQNNPDYGTHDYLAEHALKMLPAAEQSAIVHNLSLMLYGTEMPDNPKEIGDSLANHHVYYYSSGQLQSAPAATRAQEEYNLALGYLQAGDWTDADKHIGAMTHYITDLGVFGHVMGSSTDWGGEVHHSDYELYALNKTGSYTSSYFDGYIVYDGSLTGVTAYSAVSSIAYAITFGSGNIQSCTWMDSNYSWSNTTFKDSAGASMNLAVNYLAEVLHKLYLAYSPAQTESSAPTLSYGSVFPTSGGPSTAFTYEVTYTDANGDAPSYVKACVDGTEYFMAKTGGSYTSGAIYSYTTGLGAGSHTYYFSASDNSGLTARLPSSGSSSGPTVTVTSAWHVISTWNSGTNITESAVPSFDVTLAFSKPDGSPLANTTIYYGTSQGQETDALGTTDSNGNVTTTNSALAGQTVYFKSSDGAYEKNAYISPSGGDVDVALEAAQPAGFSVWVIVAVSVVCIVAVGSVLFLKRRGGNKGATSPPAEKPRRKEDDW